ncbi:MAG: BMP family ABC transporter substrate-binding protein [Alphaproteobacteria bacterium]|nr:BMP family ABC transporter substrate-binding protein [Alphaproteobacteria bacterium]
MLKLRIEIGNFAYTTCECCTIPKQEKMPSGNNEKIILGILTVVFIVAAGCENELGYDGILKIGFVYQGRASQPGWSRSHDLARRAVATALAGQVETTSVEFVAPKFAEHAMRRLALSGLSADFATAIAYQDATARVAADFPGVRFEQLGGHRRTANVATYTARFYEARAVLGLIAGNMTKTNIIGYVASIPVPEVVQGIDAFTLALRQVRPNAVVKVIWIGSFTTGLRKPGLRSIWSTSGPTCWCNTPVRPPWSKWPNGAGSMRSARAATCGNSVRPPN